MDARLAPERRVLTSRALAFGALLAALGVPAAGCAGPRGQTPAAAASVRTPPRFRTIEREVRRGLAEARRGDVAALRARRARIAREGLALLRAVLPHDVARTDVPRYLEGRAAFGAALKRWAAAVESGSDAEVVAAIGALDDACRGWIDAYLGLAPETSV